MQLVAVGPQDEKLTKDPEITFFQSVYDPYVSFALESIENTWSGVADFGRKVQVDICRSGDLVTKCVVEVDLPLLRDWTGTDTSGVGWAPNLGHTLIKEVSINIGGCDVDKHYGIWWDAWTALTLPSEKRVGYNQMIGQENLEYVQSLPNQSPDGVALGVYTDAATNQVQGVRLRTNGNQTCKNSLDDLPNERTVLHHPAQKLYIPLHFWFCVNWGLALPLIALQSHQLRLQVQFRPFQECIVLCCTTSEIAVGAVPPLIPPTVAPDAPAVLIPTDGSIRDLHMVSSVLWVDYVYLDGDARVLMAQSPHEYLIKQLQYNQGEGVSTTQPRVRLNFNHPTTELVMFFQENAAVERGTAPPPNDTQPAIYGGNQWNFYSVFNTDTGNPGIGAADFGAQPVSSLKLQMNGSDRMTARHGDYFNLVQPYNHHSNVPVNSPNDLDTRYRGLLVYSFALDPEEHQPQGTCNFSRLDTSTIIATLRNINNGNPGTVHVFAVNYNFLRVSCGMGGVAYAS